MLPNTANLYIYFHDKCSFAKTQNKIIIQLNYFVYLLSVLMAMMFYQKCYLNIYDITSFTQL